MKGMPSSYWGKFNAKTDPPSWHPLEDHCADVAACFEALLYETILANRLAKFAEISALDDTQIARLCVLAALHDIGKFNLGFQSKIFPERKRNAGHVKEVLALFDEYTSEAHTCFLEIFPYEDISSWGAEEDTIFYLLFASIAHHGSPVAVDGATHVPTIWKPQYGLDPFKGMSKFFQTIRNWFPKAFSQTGKLLPANTEFQHAFSGLVTLADWIGSNTDFFPYSEEGEEERFSQARNIAKRVLQKMALNPTQARNGLGKTPPTFSAISDFSPRDAQSKLLALPVSKEKTLSILESETGSGKTEAVLARFLLLFYQGAVDGLYFALPTRTAATQIHARVVEAMKRAFPNPEIRPSVVLAVPGYLQVDEQSGTKLPEFKVLWNDNEKERFRYRGWAAESPKRYLAGSIVVGTIDQILLSTLAIYHSHMRASTLLRQLLVVDEVHASDAHMNRLLQSVLSRHIQAGGHAILMSATLGTSAQEEFLSFGSLSSLPSLEDACQIAYPAITHWDSGSLKKLAVKTPTESKTVSIDIKNIANELNQIVSYALELASQGARVLILRNTVKDCIQTQKTLENIANEKALTQLLFCCQDQFAPHHSRFARQDRIALDKALDKSFGKKASQDKGCIVVATQTIQQSLDIDADVLLTDLCPMDVLLQRIGRVHRHERVRQKGFETALVSILTPSERNLGSLIKPRGEAFGPHGLGTVYEDLRILEATWRLLIRYPSIIIPAQNRQLVEESTHPEALDTIVNELGSRWEAHKNHLFGQYIANRQIAKLNLANWKTPIGERETCFPDKELSRKIQTRLGEGDRLIRFTESFQSPFLQTIKLLTLPAHMAKDINNTVETAENVSIRNKIVHFSFGNIPFSYNRLGLHRIDSIDTGEETNNA